MTPTPSIAKRLGVLTGALALVALTVWLLPFQVPDNLDFYAVHEVLNRFFAGSSLYAIDPEPSRTPFFPYPPWYTLALSPLAFLSRANAASAWALITIGLASVSILLLIRDHRRRSILIAITWTLLCAPVQGHIIVGQFTMPLVFGVALTFYGTDERRALLTSVGLVLATFKPHLGIPFVASYWLWSLARRGPLALRTFLLFAAMSVGTILASEAIAPGALQGYPSYLSSLSQLPLNRVCDTCSSLPLLLERASPLSAGAVWQIRLLIAGGIGVLLTLPFIVRRADPDTFFSAIISTILLATPYNRNYDFVLMLVPWALIVRRYLAVPLRLGISSAPLTTTLFVVSLCTGGILPYLLSRDLQGNLLWLAPAMTYLIAAGDLRDQARAP